MTPEDFDCLLAIVSEDITGSSRFRLPIPADMRLAVTLRYLATGMKTYVSSYFIYLCKLLCYVQTPVGLAQ